MKNIRLYATLILGVILAVSCDLNRFPETELSDANFWSSEDNFKQACNAFYIMLNGEKDIRFDDVRSDFAFDKVNGANEVSSGTRIVPAVSSDWDEPYRMIFGANKIIEKAADAKNVKSINRWIGEAKFWRAYAYFRLVSKFGDVPLILKTLDIDSPELQEGRTPRALVIQQIYDDLDYAAGNLPTFIELGSVEYGRASRSAALALKARVSLYEGTRQKFHGYGEPSSNLSVAVAAAEAVMTEGHELYSATANPYFNLFQYAGEGFANKENILSAVYGVNEAKNIRAHGTTAHIQNGWYCVTRPMVELYLCTDGLPYDVSPLAENPEINSLSIFKNKDLRMDASLFKGGDAYNNPDTYPPTPPFSVITGFNSRKYYCPADWQLGRSYIDIAIIRYAEVLLIYAEAKFELNGSISDGDLDKSINLLRDRVSMPHLTNAFVAQNGLDMRTEIRRERNVELAQEGFRYDDINRWKIAEDVLPKEVVGATYFPEFGSSGWDVSADGYLLAQPANKRFFNPAKDYLYPVPSREIALSGGVITQNPEWK